METKKRKRINNNNNNRTIKKTKNNDYEYIFSTKTDSERKPSLYFIETDKDNKCKKTIRYKWSINNNSYISTQARVSIHVFSKLDKKLLWNNLVDILNCKLIKNKHGKDECKLKKFDIKTFIWNINNFNKKNNNKIYYITYRSDINKIKNSIKYIINDINVQSHADIQWVPDKGIWWLHISEGEPIIQSQYKKDNGT